MNLKRIGTLIVILTLASAVQGQVRFGGLADFELRKGGSASAPAINQTPSDKWMVYVPSSRLFINASISDNWTVSGALQADYYYDYQSEVFFSSMNLNWLPSENIKFTLGRFVTPYGRYNELMLSSKNPFVHKPLTHVWGFPVDRRRGYVFPSHHSSGSRPSGYGTAAGQSMVYRRLYSQGLMLGGQNEEETLRYQLAATLTSASSYSDIGEFEQPAWVGRVEYQPVIWNTIGLSLSRGPYLIDDPFTENVLTDHQRSEYLQTLGTAYTEFSYHYYQLLLQYTFNRWDAPWIKSGGLHDAHMDTDISHYLAKLKVRLPFWVGAYTALRYEVLVPEKISSEEKGHDWKPTNDKQRWEVVVGYKINRNITAKISYLHSRWYDPPASASSVGIEDDVFAIQLSAGF